MSMPMLFLDLEKAKLKQNKVGLLTRRMLKRDKKVQKREQLRKQLQEKRQLQKSGSLLENVETT